ncbi:MAG: MerR family transcriptional regulator [Myxococcota bacterium]|nr:MerR family transcriptional regulator [Myxococcota bacterium]
MGVASRVALPDKLYFKIGEVANLTGVKQHVLRYWESEFSHIKPQKSKTNQRLYRRRDVEAVLAVRHLLYDLKFTIEGAKKHLSETGVQPSLPPPKPEEIAARARAEALEEASTEVTRVRAQLKSEHEIQLLSLRHELAQFLKKIETIEED